MKKYSFLFIIAFAWSSFAAPVEDGITADETPSLKLPLVKIGAYDPANGPFRAKMVEGKPIVPHPDPAIERLPNCYDLMPKKKSKKGKAKEFKLPVKMIATAYDDGGSCPGGCNTPHVVFHPKVNGTSRAHDPSSKKKKYKECQKDQDCRICFRNGRECMVTKYKGSGPPFGVFDFAVGFYQKKCGKKGLPQSIVRKCKFYATKTKKYQKKINCIKDQSDPQCSGLINASLLAKERDRVDYEKCNSMGQKAFNRTVPPARKRKFKCNYTEWKYTFKSSYKAPGKKRVACKKPWHMLLPSACKENSFVGPYGLDCCTASPYMAVAMGPECNVFYPDRKRHSYEVQEVEN